VLNIGPANVETTAYNILFAASELSPYAKTGGLGDVLAALPATLRRRGHSVSVALPLYRGLLEKLPGAQRSALVLSIHLGAGVLEAPVWTAVTEAGVRLFLIEQAEFFDRAQLYGEGGADYPDNAARFIFFGKAVVELARHLSPAPEILHLHDWQTGLVPAFVRARGLPFKTVYTIHNLAYQGSFWGVDFPLTNLPGDYFSAAGVEFYGRLNCMKAGIALADQITTVSPRYAQEIQGETYGCGLDRVLGEQRAKLTGILNGVDTVLWNPQDDPLIPANYHAGSLKGKAACKEALLADLGLPGGAPVFGCITRLAQQKGVDLIRAAMEDLLAEDLRFILLGSGDPEFEAYFRDLALRHPGKVAVRIGFDEKFAHRIIAGSDFFLMPSLYEPCGLTQMYSLRYATLPIVHETGGLADSVDDYNPETGEGTGFVFQPYALTPFREACHRALRLHARPAELLQVRRQAMRREFSWDRSAAGYEDVYRRALQP
jgi:starch synthase